MIRRLPIVPPENPADKRWIPEQIPIAELIEFPAGGYQRSEYERPPRPPGFAPVSLQPAGEIDILDGDKAVVETADFREIALAAPEKPEAHSGESEVW